MKFSIDSDSVIYFDEDQITQVLTNILSNAIKFCPVTNGEIQIELIENDDKIQISITDNGPGIPVKRLRPHLRQILSIGKSEHQKTYW